ncbi:hypothetical protein VSDG_09756 [Cytospora chrysosperma]|uniref:Uncharacterized protein n=1 Tax=Cytospora chrysosperma TaxID=252740 RepID=A0A423V9Z1_CYTCH|nr:hypothetical protein VSDG_09756 [Valsa sordida]
MPTPCEDAVSWGPGAADTLLNEENAPEGRAPPDVGEEEMMHNATATDPARGRLHEVT